MRIRMLQKKTTSHDPSVEDKTGITEELYFIINPAAQNNGSRRIWERVERMNGFVGFSFYEYHYIT